MRVSLTVCLLALVILQACAAPSGRVYVDPDEERTAGETYRSCLIVAAHKLDDGRSDASTIAMAITPVCASEWHAMAELYTRGMNDASKAMFWRRLDAHPEKDVERATNIVLAVRRGAL